MTNNNSPGPAAPSGGNPSPTPYQRIDHTPPISSRPADSRDATSKRWHRRDTITRRK